MLIFASLTCSKFIGRISTFLPAGSHTLAYLNEYGATTISPFTPSVCISTNTTRRSYRHLQVTSSTHTSWLITSLLPWVCGTNLSDFISRISTFWPAGSLREYLDEYGTHWLPPFGRNYWYVFIVINRLWFMSLTFVDFIRRISTSDLLTFRFTFPRISQRLRRAFVIVARSWPQVCISFDLPPNIWIANVFGLY